MGKMQTFGDYKGENLFLNRYESCVLEWCDVCVEDFGPLMKLLRLADGENKPFVGFIFGELLEVRNKITIACNNLERNYKPIFDIIDEKMKGRLDSCLHMSAFVLNPFYFYEDATIEHD